MSIGILLPLTVTVSIILQIFATLVDKRLWIDPDKSRGTPYLFARKGARGA